MRAGYRVAGLMLGVIIAGLPAQPALNLSRTSAASKAKELPKDIFPNQLARLPLVKRDELTDAEKKIYDALDSTDYTKDVGVWSPAGIRLHGHGLAVVTTATNEFLRKSALGGAEYELATLVISREMNCQVMWTAHEPQALRRGVSQQAIDVIRDRKPVDRLPEREAAVIALTREVFHKDVVGSATYARAQKLFGADNMVILTAIIAYRTGEAQTVRVFDQRLNPALRPLLPIP